jgi:hypothetical protein
MGRAFDMKYLSISIGVLACLTLVGCAGNNNGSYPQVADPPAFDYADGEDLRSGMHQLAFALQKLDGDLSAEYDEGPFFQQSITDSLSKIESIGKSLRRGDISSKHEFLAEGMDEFLEDVRRAKWYVEKKRYYMAGRVTGACISCHKANSY